MYGESPEDVYYYLTVYNEPIVQPAEPEGVDVEGILRGHVPAAARGPAGRAARAAQILASGVAVPWALEAQQLLRDDWGVAADVWSVTSWNELRRDGLRCDEQAFLQPGAEAPVPYVTQRLDGRARAGRRGERLHAPGAGPDPAVGAGRLRHARHRRLRLLRHPAGGPPVLPHRRPVGRRPACCCSSRDAARSTRRLPAQAVEKYRLHDVAAGTTGSTRRRAPDATELDRSGTSLKGSSS